MKVAEMLRRQGSGLLTEDNSHNESVNSDFKTPIETGRDLKHEQMPDFHNALFNVNEEGEEFIAKDEQVRQVTAILHDFYSALPDEEIDRNNRIMNHMSRSSETRKKHNKQSLTTVDACSQMINNVLISQFPDWMQTAHLKFAKQANKKLAKETVFDRINIYQKYSDLKT